MELKERQELAVSYHKKGYNCAQATLCAFCDVTGLSEKEALAVSGGFGGGARHADMCGTVSGAIMVLGIVNPYDDETDAEKRTRIAALTRKVHKKFIDKFGHNACRDLLGIDISTDEALARAKASGVTANCNTYIAEAVRIVCEVLAE